MDLATELDARALERAVNEADKRNLVSADALRESLVDFEGEPGVRSLRALLDRHAFRLSDSDLELLFRPIAAEAGLPPPLTKDSINGFEVDFFWPELGLIVRPTAFATTGRPQHKLATTFAIRPIPLPA